ncbi:MFS transporter [Nonomuraea phyllanthi]|uniref:MFS transporter n=1 Tax=Nonomuraea phyllanthi TaxID=2219224 RepID=A0A5C4VIK0_9ACTN|nr:MFS transporter [Nonomuraea phyllanthi]KAB8191075.1 MFS transporter [Nonomuraea phyllanthi]
MSVSSRRRLVLGVVLTAAFMDNMDATIVSIALPRIQRDLAGGSALAQWSLAGYALAFAVLLITGGRLGDIFGRRRIFLLGVAGFTLASVVCGAATAPEMLVAGRFAQGALAALMVPQVMSVIVAMFEPHERARAFAMLGAVLSAGSVSGPFLGGLLTEYDLAGLGWRAIFLINAPIGMVTFWLAVRAMPETRSTRPLRLDLVGVVLVALIMVGVLYPLTRGSEAGWPGWMYAVIAAAVAAVPAFAAHQRWRHRLDGSALVPPALFARRSFTVGVVVVLLVFSGVTSFFLVMTYHLQAGLGWAPLRVALVTLAWPLGITVTTRPALRRASRRLVGAGAAVMAAGVTMMIASVTVLGAGLSWPYVVAAELVIGLGMGLCVPILATVALSEVPADDAGAGSGVVNTAIQLGTALGVAVVGAVFFALAGDGFASATATALWFNVAVFAVAALVGPLLPGARTREPLAGAH